MLHQELSQDCGYGSGSAASCVPCSARWFKEDWGSHGCRLCRVCRRVNRREVSACTPSRDALCGECLPGFYSKRRLDGGEDVECMTCGPSTFSELQCSRGKTIAVEQVWEPEATTSVCVTVVILLFVSMFIYLRRSSVRKLFKGCLTPQSNSHYDTEDPSVSTETQFTVTQGVKEKVSGEKPGDLRCGLPVFTAAASDSQVGVSGPPRCSVCSDCSSGFVSQHSTGLPTTDSETSATVPCSEGLHCASDGSGPLWHHAPVECTELDFHDCSDLYSSPQPESSSELQVCARTGEMEWERGRGVESSCSWGRVPGCHHHFAVMDDATGLLKSSCKLMQGVLLADLPPSLEAGPRASRDSQLQAGGAVPGRARRGDVGTAGI
ncbi:tumor necrosis factor receptor superfamily member 27 isoform X2 [Denticeps clupeoides]|uniref:tumor necrosis factor receptor superfamily member 27 isoform X2 n=1 Tax=Denticeps clupeoides TaxID=299321 RepID=UPI0010A58EA9|nr:tumor necrosis factor receptor superfamily member 27 isoform X2 [Denticeps clupeoides]